uniref:Uncharacterized protein n=1 Tax=Timema bartmani TaxID=61472 RepID=A0A7R9F2C7_9NEOP|nr:unnamed protein product [Timema bartmani]
MFPDCGTERSGQGPVQTSRTQAPVQTSRTQVPLSRTAALRYPCPKQQHSGTPVPNSSTQVPLSRTAALRYPCPDQPHSGTPVPNSSTQAPVQTSRNQAPVSTSRTQAPVPTSHTQVPLSQPAALRPLYRPAALKPLSRPAALRPLSRTAALRPLSRTAALVRSLVVYRIANVLQEDAANCRGRGTDNTMLEVQVKDPKENKPCWYRTSGIGEPSVYHALVVIFLEFFAWGLLTMPIIANIEEPGCEYEHLGTSGSEHRGTQAVNMNTWEPLCSEHRGTRL